MLTLQCYFLLLFVIFFLPFSHFLLSPLPLPISGVKTSAAHALRFLLLTFCLLPPTSRLPLSRSEISAMHKYSAQTGMILGVV
ncbi:hypothetical protein PRUPE_6G174900 [Prunus persica]|uniref:Uncharacterized protein n=1 Tax=Prunus persica TaxID=3760 RepID=A0A251NS31_PRUPE|nr:hypothetical protein PRUPE_6G174900 [Prunus persica]